jgi:hypothetical protein
MKINKLALLFLISILSANIGFAQKDSTALREVIEKVQDHKAYERDEYPLGLYTKNFFRREASFARKNLEKLQEINRNELSQSDQISLELLKFKLKETVDFYETDASIKECESKGKPRIGVGKNSRIENAIIDKNARIGDNVVISPAGKADHVDHDLYYIRDGIVIIPKNGVVPHGTVI